MARLRLNIAMSLDGFVAGPNQSEDDPLGEGGMQLHEWAFKLAVWRRPHGQEGGEVNESTEVVEESLDNVGATVMGRHMFGGGEGPWGEEPWNGWWGDDPPFHTPPVARMSRSGAAPTSRSSTWRRACSTRSRSTSSRSCSAAAPGCSTTSRLPTPGSSRSGWSRRPGSPTSNTASSSSRAAACLHRVPRMPASWIAA
jgi:hypothetical protein